MTALGQINAGGRLTAAEARGVAPLSAVKALDQAITNSVTLVNDDALYLPLPSAGTFGFEAFLAVVSSVATGSGDLKAAFTWPAGANGLWSSLGYTTSGVVNINGVKTSSGAAVAIGAGTTEVGTWLSGTIVMGGTAGLLQFQFAQNTASVAQSITVRALSRLWAWQTA